MYFLYHSHIIFFTDSHVWVASLGREALLRVKFKIGAGTSCRCCRNGENVKLPCDISTGLIISEAHFQENQNNKNTEKQRHTACPRPRGEGLCTFLVQLSGWGEISVCRLLIKSLCFHGRWATADPDVILFKKNCGRSQKPHNRTLRYIICFPPRSVQ